jgi:hypothetical protein
MTEEPAADEAKPPIGAELPSAGAHDPQAVEERSEDAERPP